MNCTYCMKNRKWNGFHIETIDRLWGEVYTLNIKDERTSNKLKLKHVTAMRISERKFFKNTNVETFPH